MGGKIVDADGHIVEKDSEIRARLPEPFNQRRGALVGSDGMDTSMNGVLGGMEGNDLPTRLANSMNASRASISVAAENLAFLWRAQKDSYGAKWIDPELLPNRVNDVTGNYSYTQESWPQLARFHATFRFTF